MKASWPIAWNDLSTASLDLNRRERLGETRSAGWKPSEEYVAAMQELPFRSHNDGMVQVVMEAAGLENIHSIPMQAVVEARREHEALNPTYGVLQGTPYILVGRRV